MISFDVTSLFTNVPVLETVEYICDYMLENNISVGVPTRKLKELLLRCTMNVQFLFNDTFYREIDGVAMGSPLGPIMADIFMAKLENTVLSEQIKTFDFYGRYVDDTFAICSSEFDPDEILTKLNQAHNAINFTMEKETENQIPFLDALLLRQSDGSIRRKVYRKPTWTDQYINFHSFVPLRRKRNLVRNLAFRARKICSPEMLSEELQFLRELLLKNGYPEKFISRNLKQRIRSSKIPTVERKSVYLKLPYKGEVVSNRLSNRIARIVEQTYPAAKLTMVFTSRPILNPCLKDKLSRSTTSFAVYLFTCVAAYISVARRDVCLNAFGNTIRLG
ncbi:unnamed protein product [Calicophoron daubneyi]|uniref:Reverse transcriptase domain-containing protein n=1 Tax=Calicophoron daubneyi TaxID=300641 RepID=A0AAV2SZN3_CALDB